MRRCFLFLWLFAACTPPGAGWRPPEPLSPPALADSVWVCDQHAGRATTIDAMLDGLARHEVVFFGETHLDETTHRLELAVYEGLIEKTQGKVVLALEMFERDVQPALDDYVAGRIDEAKFLSQARPWSNYRTGYRRLIERARKDGLPVVASNIPAAIRRKVGFGGREAMDALPAEERALLPAELFDNSDAYWERVERVMRGHFGMIGADNPERRVTLSQSLWDNTMGESCALALERHPGHVVLHVNGAFHSQYRDGTVHQLLKRRPQTKVALLEAVPTDELYGFDPFGAAERADYLVFVARRARGLNEGFQAVTTHPELRYRLRTPHRAERPYPLLVWLGDDGFRAADGLAVWSAALGEEAAIAAVEAPYPIVGDDLVLGARWAWPETFEEDVGTLHAGLTRIVGYVLRHYPVDPERVVIAGEGTGATVVATLALYQSELTVPMIAAGPRRHGKLRTMALPGRAEGSLKVLPLEGDADWWKEEAEAHRKAGLATEVAAASANGWERLRAVEDEIRMALRLTSRPMTAGAGTCLVLETDTPRARHWAYRRALAIDGPVAVSSDAPEGWTVEPLVVKPGDFAKGNLPLASGPFGGTTILIVPKGASEEERTAWKDLAEKDVIKKRSRFARLVVLFDGDEGAGLAAALEEIRGTGRRSVLVAPAAFCVDDDTMRRYRAEAKAYEDTLDVEWLPGVGGMPTDL